MSSTNNYFLTKVDQEVLVLDQEVPVLQEVEVLQAWVPVDPK
jgi:hypothetical protein